MIEIRVNNLVIETQAKKAKFPNALYFKSDFTNTYYHLFWSILCVYLYGNRIRIDWINKNFSSKSIYIWEDYDLEIRYVNT